MTTHAVVTGKSLHPLVWVVGIAVIVFCLAGAAAVFGWIPGSLGGGTDGAAVSAVSKPPAKAARAATGKTPEKVASAATSKAPAPVVVCMYCGVIESIREVVAKGEGSGMGAAGGAVVGGLLGHQVGGGSGKQIATVVGAVGGAVAGNEVEKRVKSTKSQEVTVRLEDGSSRVITESGPVTWMAGDHVKIIDGALRRN
jgi:outer membrane lipoprotein SlyB